MDRAIHAAKAFLPITIDVIGCGIACLFGGFDEDGIERVFHWAIAGMKRTAFTAIGIAALVARLGFAEIGQHIAVAPAFGAKRFPALVIHRIAANIDHAIDG